MHEFWELTPNLLGLASWKELWALLIPALPLSADLKQNP